MALESSNFERKKAYNGLSKSEVERKIKEFGLNSIISKKKISPFKIFLQQFSDFMVLILIVCAFVSFFMGEIGEAVAIVIIIFTNAFFGFYQEYNAEKTLKALRELSAPMAKVLRDGKKIEILAEYLVPDDILYIEAGDKVPADAILVEGDGISINEAILTGESLPVEKSIYKAKNIKIKRDEKLENYIIYMGTSVTRGHGIAKIINTGMKTEMGKIAKLIDEVEEGETPLKKRLEHMGKSIGLGCLAICAIVSLAGVLRGEEVFTMLLTGISLAVAAVPEGLPAVVTIALAMGIQRMAKRNALVKKLHSVETLGCATVICTDKTGTLTENKMSVKRVFSDFKEYSPSIKMEIKNNITVQNLIECLVLCNNAEIQEKKGLFSRIKKFKTVIGEGDPTEIALLELGNENDITKSNLAQKYERIKEIPFDSERKLMSTVYKTTFGNNIVYTKGAMEVLLNRCTKIQTSSGIKEINEQYRKLLLNSSEFMAQNAMRIIAGAYKEIGNKSCEKIDENELIFLGFVGMLDPPRKEAYGAVKNCKNAGIKVVMITGDHPLTAKAIAKELGILGDSGKVLTGAEIDKLSPEKFDNVVCEVSVFARTSPAHKLQIVRALKKKGHIVAMTGDGVNDAPALKESDIGIAMGKSGTEVTKEASSIIILDDNFATIISAVNEGRVIYANIKKFIRYMLSCNIGEVITMFVVTLIGWPIPLLPIQVLWVNLVTDGLPAIALGKEPAEDDVMKYQPRKTTDNIFSGGLLRKIISRGILIGISTVAVFAFTLFTFDDLVRARTNAFLTLVLSQLINVFECKLEYKPIYKVNIFNNIFLLVAVAISMALTLAVIYIPSLSEVFETMPLNKYDWGIALIASLIGTIITLIGGFFKKKK